MQDKTPGVAPDPKLVFPLSLGMKERLRRPILDHMLLKTLQACTVIIQFLEKNRSYVCISVNKDDVQCIK